MLTDRRITRRTWIVGAIAVVVLAALVAAVAFSLPERARPLSDDEAQRLALARLGNYEATTGRFRTELATAGTTLRLHGVVDWRRHVGTAVMRTDGRSDPDSNVLLQWNLSTVAIHPGGAVDGDPPPPPQDARWKPRPLARTGSDLDSTLLLLLSLASDRPENPQLLAQSGAQYLRSDSVDGTDVDVVSGPTKAGQESRVAYWIAGDRLRRVEARLGKATEPTVIDLSDAGGTQVAAIPDLLTG